MDNKRLDYVAGVLQRVRIEEVRPNLSIVPVLAFRVCAKDYAEAERIAAQYLTEWLQQNPGRPATYVISSLSRQERGEE